MDIDRLIRDVKCLTLEEFFEFWEEQKDVFIIKYDGVRPSKRFTVLLLSDQAKFATINVECEGIMIGVEEVLLKYRDILRNVNESGMSPS